MDWTNYSVDGQISMFDLTNDKANQRKKSTDWKWSFKDYPKKNGLKAFSCFACGGGSTMGYKLAGVDVIGCCELDPKMNEIYVKNHNPKHNFCMDIRDFNNIPNEVLPPELFDLDILDGSPPCTTFSMAGQREETWGKEKKFREGQKLQTLDDLSFVFIETAKKLRPKTVIMENVEGLLLGNAWKYVQEIYKQFNDIGYRLHHWLLKGEEMGVPQTRHRVIFVAIREDIGIEPKTLDMFFNYEFIPYGVIKDGIGGKVSDVVKYLLSKSTEEDICLADIIQREKGKWSRFNEKIIWDKNICCTVQSHGMYRGNDKTKFSISDYRNAQTFPQDYIFDSVAQAAYVCGMSVPPIMIKRIVQRLIEQGVYDYKLKEQE